ncbi:MAG TPA: DUF262 domain-containing protein [Chthoniobacterales bacterium]|nr:DUF262 domain-containing protein [Chthoniobacterales bacterium]
MEANNVAISKVFSSGGDIHYVLPHFQREYTWEKSNWETMLNDALAVYDEMQPASEGEGFTNIEHFLGSIVVIHDGMRSGTVSAFKLVDGQQRLTTISLLLKALSSAIEQSQPNLARKIEKLLINGDETGDLFFKILPTVKYGDRDAYCALMSGHGVAPTTSKINRAYGYFREQLIPKLAENLNPEKLLNVLLNSFQVVFVNLNQNESPYRIFESLNAKGKPLTQADLVRNYIAMRLPSTRQERVFAEYWSGVEDLLQETRYVGRLPELTAFLRHYLAMTSGILCDETHVYARFRDRAEKDFGDAGSFEQELSVISRFASFYDQLLRPAKIADEEIARKLHRLNSLETLTSYPFMLRVFQFYHEGVLTRAEIVSAVDVIENYMVRRYLAGEPQSYLNRMFPALWSEVRVEKLVESLKSALGQRNYPTNARLLRSLETRKLYDKSEQNRRRTTLVLESVNRRLSEGSGGYTVLDSRPTIEHVMPQTLNDQWKKDLGIQWEQSHRDYLHTIGNLTLVTSEWNASLSNASFAIKKPKLASHALRINNSYFSREIAGWNRDGIRERAEDVGETILQIWPSFLPSDVVDLPDSLRVSERPAASEFDDAAVERIAKKLSTSLRRLSRARFESEDGRLRVVGLCSKGYPRGADAVRYWYGIKPSQNDFLQLATSSWIAFECESPEKVILLQFSFLQPLLKKLQETEGKHWHVEIFEKAGQFEIDLPITSETVLVTDRLVRS